MAGRYDEAIAGATAALQLQPRFGPTLRVAIAAYALAGEPKRAQEMMAKHRAIEPQTRISTLRGTYLRRVTAQAFDVLLDGLRKAGFPE